MRGKKFLKTIGPKMSLWNAAACGILSIVVIVAYQRMFFAYFQGDDFVTLEYLLGQTNLFHTQINWFSSGNGIFYRPLSFISFAMDYVFWKTYAPGFHLTNIVLHYCNSLLILGIG